MKFKSRLLALVVCVFAWVGANAQTEETVGNYVKKVTDETGKVTVVVSNLPNISTFDNWNPPISTAEKTAIKQAQNLKLNGTVGNESFNLLGRNDVCQPKELDLSDAIIADANDANGSGGQQMPSGWEGCLESIILPTDQDFTCVPEQFCNQYKKLNSITFQPQITGIGKQAFQMSENEGSSLESVTLPPNLVNIWDNAFQRTALKSISIPGTVEYIGYQAFSTDNSLETIVFQAAADDPNHHMSIAREAFFNSKVIKDVYIETTSQITCANGAFDYDTTFGNTNPNAETATLHFPSTPSSLAAHYANLGHPLTLEEVKDPAAFHLWLSKHWTKAQDNHNGWHEFINNGAESPNPPIYETGKFLFTWCDMDNDRLVPEGVKAYIVTSLDEHNNVVPLSNGKELHLARIFAIPKGTGVILYGQTNSHTKTGKPSLTMTVCSITNSTPLTRDNWNTLKQQDHAELQNLLMPTGTGINDIKPYDNVLENNVDVRYRNFGMGRFNSTGLSSGMNVTSNYVGFFRLRPGNLAGGKAYLRLRANEYVDGTGAEAVIIGDTETYPGSNYKNYQVEYDRSQQSPSPKWPEQTNLWWADGNHTPNMKWEDDSNWGDRSKNNFNGFMAKFMGETFYELIEEVNGIATSVSPASMVEYENDESYYTLQGVKVTNPRHGVYIKNGKKVIK